MLQQHTGYRRSHCRTGRTGGTPDPDPAHPLTVIGEHRAQQRQRGGHQPGAGETLHGPRHDEQRGRGRHRRQNRSRTEGDTGDQQQPLATDPVAQIAHRDEHPGEHEGIDVTDPEDLVVTGMQFVGDRRHRDADDGSVDGHHEHRQTEREQGRHLTPVHPGNPTAREPRSDQG